jgi:aryl-alcohol dehydrogenase-like predicted oxidoreductase
MGCWGIGGYFYLPDGRVTGYGEIPNEQGIKTIETAIESGINFFDTADVYGVGNSERLLGSVIPEYRDDLVIATKFGTVFDIDQRKITGSNASSEYIRTALNNSLDRLQTDYIDLYQLHINGYNLDKASQVRDTLEDLVGEGLIRSYGWSTDSVDRARIFIEGEHCTSIQYLYNIINRNDRMLELTKEAHVASILKGPLGYGLLTGKYRDDSTLPETHMWHGEDFSSGKIKIIRTKLEELKELLTEDGRTLSQAAISWLWANDPTMVPIPGAKSPQQIRENAATLDFGPLPQQKMSEIEHLFSNLIAQIDRD